MWQVMAYDPKTNDYTKPVLETENYGEALSKIYALSKESVLARLDHSEAPRKTANKVPKKKGA